MKWLLLDLGACHVTVSCCARHVFGYSSARELILVDFLHPLARTFQL